MEHNGREIVNIQGACDAVGVTRRTIYNWINKKKIEYIRTSGGSIRIYKDTLYHVAGPRAN